MEYPIEVCPRCEEHLAEDGTDVRVINYNATILTVCEFCAYPDEQTIPVAAT
jgi:hypothetical protein